MVSKQAQKLRAAIAECREIISEHERHLREYENMLYELEHGDESDRDKTVKDFEFFFGGEGEEYDEVEEIRAGNNQRLNSIYDGEGERE